MPVVINGTFQAMSVQNVNGVNQYTVSNPWGKSDGSLENPLGIAVLTYAEIAANFNWLTEAT